jgi:hypothetical protein
MAANHLGPFEAVRDLHYDAPFPRLLPVRQKFDAPQVRDVAAATREALEPLRARVKKGMRVALTVGSRGIHDVPVVLRETGAWLHEQGAEPFVVPAMGSHGGATAEGQVQLLASLGVTEESVGLPIEATMETVELGRVPDGPMAHLDANVARADAVIAINRVKAHTDFHGEIESGLAKIIAIGLGKQRGAEGIHRYGPRSMAVWVPRVARRIIETGKVLGGLAIVENAFDRAAEILLLEPDDIGGPGEAAVLERAKTLMPGIPFDAVDVVVVDQMGKNISGSGLDTNVIGRMMIRGSEEFERPRIANLVVLDLTDSSHGNTTGVGLADFIPFRILEKVDLRSAYVNAMTSGLGGPQRGQIPIALPTDRDAVAAALLTCGRADLENARVLRVHSTLDLELLLVSESLRDQVEADDRLSITGEAVPLGFDRDGVVADWSAWQ